MKQMQTKKGQSNRIKRGTLSVLYTVVFLVLVLSINLVISSISGSVRLNIDLSSEDLISIGEISHNVLDKLDREGDLNAKIYLLADRDAYDSAGSDAYGLNLMALIRDLCEEYAYEYEHISVEYKNLERDPEWAKAYTKKVNRTLSRDCIIIEGTHHARVLRLESFLTRNEDTNTYNGFNGELRLTTALLQSCMSEPQVVTFTTGHGEPQQLSGDKTVTSLATMLFDAGFEVLETDLSREAIDPRTRILIVNDPQNDFGNDEIERLMEYTATYNSLIVLVDDQTPELPNLSDYLREDWGIGYRAYHQITSDTNFGFDKLNLSAQCVTSYENPDSSAAYEIIKNIIYGDARQLPLSMPNSVELYEAPYNPKNDFTVEKVLLSGSGKSTHQEEETEGVFPLMLLSSNMDYVDNNGDANSQTQTQRFQYVMLIGSTEFAADGTVGNSKYTNSNLLLAAARTMGAVSYNLKIDPKLFNEVALTIETDIAFRLGVLVCAILPTLVLIAGLVVFFRRRHL